MAISPKAKYPSQTDATDAAYPYGKAKNQQVAGDGTGTPWEATLVNDVFGFQQALLAAAAIVPSGNPDKVGASQYLAAVNALIVQYGNTLAGLLADKPAFKNNGYFWGGVHTFEAGLMSPGPIDLVAPIATKSLVPLRDAVGLSATGQYQLSNTKIQAKGDGSNQQVVQFPVRLPSGSSLLGARVGGKSNASTFAVTIRQHDPGILAGTEGSYSEIPLLAPATIVGGPNYTTANISGAALIINESSEYWIDVNVGTSAAAYAEIYFVQLAWSWATLTNQ